MKKVKILIEAILLLIILQAVREILEMIMNSFVIDESFTHRMITMTIMCFLSIGMVLLAKITKTKLSIFPEHFGKGYIVGTIVAAVLLISTPSNFIGGYQAILLLIYGSIVTPIYEELIFRGYIWNRLEQVLTKERYIYIWSVGLFTLWHLGYMIPHLVAGNWNAVAWKLLAGLGYGAILGFIRVKTKNCYSTMLVHGVLNNFMV